MLYTITTHQFSCSLSTKTDETSLRHAQCVYSIPGPTRSTTCPQQNTHKHDDAAADCNKGQFSSNTSYRLRSGVLVCTAFHQLPL